MEINTRIIMRKPLFVERVGRGRAQIKSRRFKIPL
jgi:hypothetical protein